MSYRVKVQGTGEHPLKRYYGTGREGNGGNYKTRDGADARAKSLKREFRKHGFTVTVVKSS